MRLFKPSPEQLRQKAARDSQLDANMEQLKNQIELMDQTYPEWRQKTNTAQEEGSRVRRNSPATRSTDWIAFLPKLRIGCRLACRRSNVMVSFAMDRISSFALERHMAPLKRNHVRYFCQPMGLVASALDVNFAKQTVTLYKGYGSKEIIRDLAVDPVKLTGLKQLLKSNGFRKMPSTNSKVGCDGCSYFVEFRNSLGIYAWKCHWAPDDQIYREVINAFEVIMQEFETQNNQLTN